MKDIKQKLNTNDGVVNMQGLLKLVGDWVLCG